MKATSRWTAGDVIVVQEWWRGHLWSAIPHTMVSDGDYYLTYLPAGTAGTFASSIRVPGRDHLPRAERKLLALETCVYEVVERCTSLSMLHFFSPGSYARVNLGWSEDNSFLGWYVNFELPPTIDTNGLRTTDLVLDIIVRPDRGWEWKDRADFDQAVQRGVLDQELLTTLEDEADRIVAQVDSGDGPFDDAWLSWRPDPRWRLPELPAEFRVGGRYWRG